MDKQCPSCGGFCKKSECERENVARHEPVAWRFQSPTGGWAYAKEPPVGFKYAAEPLYTAPPQSFTYEQVKAHIKVALLSSQPVVKESLTTEPVAWINFCGATGEMTVDFDCESELASIPLYEKEQL